MYQSITYVFSMCGRNQHHSTVYVFFYHNIIYFCSFFSPRESAKAAEKCVVFKVL